MLLQEAMRRGLSSSHEDKVQSILRDGFTAQLPFIRDESDFSVCDSGRRAGKTDAELRKLLVCMLLKPDSKCAFVTQTTGISKELVWLPLQAMNEKYSLGMHFNHSELTATLPNGSRLRLSGLATAGEIGKLRGKGYTLIVVDETQDIAIDMEEFIQSVCLPALLDKRGQLVLCGTADPFRRNKFWYESCAGDDTRWKRFKWNIVDNPHLIDPQGYLDKMLTTGGFTANDPRFRAEFYGDWTLATSSLLICDYTPENHWKLSPTGARYICGLDLGLVDATAWVVFQYDPSSRQLFIIDTLSKSGLSEDEVGATCIDFTRKYPGIVFVADMGALGKMIAQSLSARYGLKVVPAQKYDKALNISFLNSDFRTKRLWLSGKHKELTNQFQSVTWDEKHQREAEGQACDLLDACLYGYGQCRNFRDQPTVPRIPDMINEFPVRRQ